MLKNSIVEFKLLDSKKREMSANSNIQNPSQPWKSVYSLSTALGYGWKEAEKQEVNVGSEIWCSEQRIGCALLC